jgi:hypothetical protein
MERGRLVRVVRVAFGLSMNRFARMSGSSSSKAYTLYEENDLIPPFSWEPAFEYLRELLEEYMAWSRWPPHGILLREAYWILDGEYF